ncbi:HlyD family efflux transporter periplasmic adaptor subunit [Nocardioides sp. QY071]|uniref:HlyD family efflux transporter periplasmic adaptor subunit n=1 Tax=Nocardioides sp. QY071 TaxID=3044187 RepID=UPI002499D4D9|nr:HlyD family efflux transporter periplasmic adaptor subunit [Nocardioides sp. QY071]WGY03999.1 HlyD family efflux transporter periplasmic adaptor subunit [Nocardioides sp. QY071]
MRRAPRRVVVPLAVLALAGTGFAAYGATGDDAVSYRTVVAATGDVEQTLDLSGVIGASGRSDLAFGTDGEVARVPVAVGDEVRQGQVIAVLDRAALRAAVDQARSDLASAKARLADDEDAQAASVATATTSTPATEEPSGSSGSSGSPTKGATPTATTPDLTALTAQQDAVTSAQSAAGTALERSTAALATQEQACRATADPTGAPSSDPTDAPSSEPTDGSGLDEDCTQALAAVQSAQSATAQAQQALQDAISTLTATLTAALGDLVTGSGLATPDAPSSDAPTSDAPTSDAVPSDATPSRTVTAATLADDQAAIDKAKSDLASARADLEAAAVRAPAAGTVTSLSVAKGDDVSSGDTVAVVVAPGVTTVSLEVTETEAARLRTGTAVEATPSGATDPLAGEISRVSNVPTSSASDSTSDTASDPTYAVDITLDERDLALPEGLPASVEVVVGSAQDAVTVPASAISDGTVTTLVDGRAERVRVTTGIVGSTDVEIVDGIEAGTRVVLADLDADLPSSDGQDQQGFGGGGFGGNGVRMGPPGGSVTIRR